MQNHCRPGGVSLHSNIVLFHILTISLANGKALLSGTSKEVCVIGKDCGFESRLGRFSLFIGRVGSFYILFLTSSSSLSLFFFLVAQ